VTPQNQLSLAPRAPASNTGTRQSRSPTPHEADNRRAETMGSPWGRPFPVNGLLQNCARSCTFFTFLLAPSCTICTRLLTSSCTVCSALLARSACLVLRVPCRLFLGDLHASSRTICTVQTAPLFRHVSSRLFLRKPFSCPFSLLAIHSCHYSTKCFHWKSCNAQWKLWKVGRPLRELRALRPIRCIF
jgi:hypothetical protein